MTRRVVSCEYDASCLYTCQRLRYDRHWETGKISHMINVTIDGNTELDIVNRDIINLERLDDVGSACRVNGIHYDVQRALNESNTASHLGLALVWDRITFLNEDDFIVFLFPPNSSITVHSSSITTGTGT